MKRFVFALCAILAGTSPAIASETLELTTSPQMANPVGTDVLPLVRTDPKLGPSLFQVTMDNLLKSVVDVNAVHKTDDISNLLVSPNYGSQDTLTNVFGGLNNRLNTLVSSTVVRNNGTATGLTINYGNYKSGIADNVDLSNSYAIISGTGGQMTSMSSLMSGTYGMSATDKRGISIYYSTTGGMPYLRYDGGSIGLLPASGGTGNDNIFLRPAITNGSLSGTDISAANLSSTLTGAQAASNISANAAAITAESARAQLAETSLGKSTVAVVGSANGAGSAATDTVVSSIGVTSATGMPWLYMPSTKSYLSIYPTAIADAKFVSAAAGSSTNQTLTSPIINGGSVTNGTLENPTINDGTLNDTDLSNARLNASLTGKAAALQIAANSTNLVGEVTRAKAQEATLAPLNSPVLTGNPQTPTVNQGNNSSTIASTGYVDTGLGNLKGNLVARTGGVSTNQTLTTPTITGGSVSNTDLTNGVVTLASGRSVSNVGSPTSVSRTLMQHFADIPNILDYGAVPGASDSAPSILSSVSTSAFPIVNFPYSGSGYTVGTISNPRGTLLDANGRMLNWNRGIFFFNENIFSGAGLGTPETGSGSLISTYTNPWNVTTGMKMTFDPAAVPQKDHVTNQAVSIECRPNRPNASNQTLTRNWIACVYRGADTGTGGAPGTSINTEVDNDVLNLNTNSGVAYEIDVNVNGNVLDGGISRGILLTGGGGDGLKWRSVALDIQHGTYSGNSALNWNTGVSVRNSYDSFEAYAESDGLGALYSGYDKNGNKVFHIDTSGNAGMNIVTAQGGFVTHTTKAPGYAATAANADDFTATKASASDSGFFFRAYDENAQQIATIDKNGYVAASGFTSRGTVKATPTGATGFSATTTNADDFVAIKASTDDTGFFFRGYDENGHSTAAIDKNGFIFTPGTITTKHFKPASTTSCTYGEMHFDDNYLYVCISTGYYKSVALSAVTP